MTFVSIFLIYKKSTIKVQSKFIHPLIISSIYKKNYT